MNHFRTELKNAVSKNTISLKHHILTLGSCFSDVIGAKLNDTKIACMANPFGVIYNPLSLHKALSYIIHTQDVSQHTFLLNQDLHLNYDFHSSFSSQDKSSLQEALKQTILRAHHYIKKCNLLIITYGTAWVYQRTDTEEVVANCHKMPAQNFFKRLLSQEEIVGSFSAIMKDMIQINPDIRIIITVSPVRHIKDTLPLNMVSKSLLRLVCHNLSEAYPHVEYFPSYEIMMDDLRDYRFYKSDMIHPNEQAEEYIWEKFTSQYMDDATKQFKDEWKIIRAALHHKPFNPGSSGHQNFLKQTIHKLEELKNIVNVDEEIMALQAQLKPT